MQKQVFFIRVKATRNLVHMKIPPVVNVLYRFAEHRILQEVIPPFSAELIVIMLKLPRQAMTID